MCWVFQSLNIHFWTNGEQFCVITIFLRWALKYSKISYLAQFWKFKSEFLHAISNHTYQQVTNCNLGSNMAPPTESDMPWEVGLKLNHVTQIPQMPQNNTSGMNNSCPHYLLLVESFDILKLIIKLAKVQDIWPFLRQVEGLYQRYNLKCILTTRPPPSQQRCCMLLLWGKEIDTEPECFLDPIVFFKDILFCKLKMFFDPIFGPTLFIIKFST